MYEGRGDPKVWAVKHSPVVMGLEPRGEHHSLAEAQDRELKNMDVLKWENVFSFYLGAKTTVITIFCLSQTH